MATTRMRPLAPSRTGTRVAVVVVALVLLVVVALASLAIGARPVPLDAVARALFGGLDPASPDAQAVVGLRVPRTIAGIAAGAALGVSGVVAQSVTRNPLADPGILGVTAGSAFAVAIAVGVLGIASTLGYVWFALAGALITSLAVALLGGALRARGGPLGIALAGLAFGAVLAGITNGLVLVDARRFQAITAWRAGSLSERDWSQIAPVLPIIAIGLVAAALAARPLGAVALGDDHAASVGVNVTGLRVVAILIITLLAGGATAIAGPLSFVGLMVAHVARRVVGASEGWQIALAAVIGPTILVASDIVGRVVAPPGELAAGLVTAAVGAVVLIVLVRRRTAVAA